jgi:hypothetical protein
MTHLSHSQSRDTIPLSDQMSGVQLALSYICTSYILSFSCVRIQVQDKKILSFSVLVIFSKRKTHFM